LDYFKKLFVRRNFKSKINRKKRNICKRYNDLDMLKKASKIALMNAMIDFFLLNKNQEFSITANIEPVTFTPEFQK
jgi:hypothetical protein